MWNFIFFFKSFNFSDSFFFHLKRELNCHYFAKKSSKSDQWFWRYLQRKKLSKIGFGKPIFDPRAHKWAPIFVFMCYFCSVIRNKEFDISQGVFTLHFWKIDFFLPYFALLPVFTKSATGRQRAVIAKNLCDFPL